MRDLLAAMTTATGVHPATNASIEADRVRGCVLSSDDGSVGVFASAEGN